MTTREGLPVSKPSRSWAALAWAALACALAFGARPAFAEPPADSTAVAPAPPDSSTTQAPPDSAEAPADSTAAPVVDPFSATVSAPGSVRIFAVPDSVPLPTAPDSVRASATPDTMAARGAPVGFLSVRSIPSGLAVLVDSLAAGRTPIDSLRLAPGSYLVRVLEPDPRRFDPAIDAVEIALHRDAAVSVLIDLRPSILLRSTPEPSSVFLTARPAEAPDSLLGVTPLRVRPSVIETAKLRFTSAGYADTTLLGFAFVGDSASVSRVRLRGGGKLAAPPPSAASGAPVYRKGWFQWTLIGLGAALSGAAVAFHHQGDEAYDRYLESSNVSEIPGLYDDAVRYDRYAAASLAAGQACLVTGFVLLVTGQR